MLKTSKLFLFPSSFCSKAFYSSEATATIRVQQAFAVLGLDESASVDDIKHRFSDLAKQYHPDTGGDEVSLLLRRRGGNFGV